MDIPQFKDVLQKLSIFKKHSSLLVPVVVLMIGALLFIPTQLMSSRLKAQISQESITKRGRQVSALQENTPASDQWQVEKELQQLYKTDANEISLLATKLTQRQLLSDKVFPKPADLSISVFQDFGSSFRLGIDELLRKVRGGECPTEAELKRSLGAISSGSGRSARLTQGVLGSAGTEIQDALCRSKAESASVYINPVTLSGYEFWGEYQYAGTPQAVQDCWYHQLSYWIMEDVIDTIEVMNSGSKNVFTSPVKRLCNIWFSSGKQGAAVGSVVKIRRRPTTMKSGTQVARDVPAYVLTILDGLAVPWTGRVCNSDIDVVHFNVRVIVDTKAVLRFMQQLCSAKEHIVRESGEQISSLSKAKHNQITILESKIKSVNHKDSNHDLYRYGEDAVVELELICEYVFSKKGYEDIKPVSIKQLLVPPVAPMDMSVDPRRTSVTRPVTR